MIDWMGTKLLQIQHLVQTGLVVAAIVFVGHIWWRTKALIPTLGAMLLAGTVVWGASNVDWIKAKIDQEMHSLPAATRQVSTLPAPLPPAGP